MKITGTITAIVGTDKRVSKQWGSEVTLPADSAPNLVTNAFHQVHQQLHNLASSEAGMVVDVEIASDAAPKG